MSRAEGLVLPTVGAPRAGGPAPRDLATGWTLLTFWGGPLAWMVGASLLGPLLRVPSAEFGALLLVGTLWFGASCLVNALRCGRTHCWVDGVLLPVLAAAGGVNLALGPRFSWEVYLSAFWGILVLSFALECAVGSYPGSNRPTPVR